MGWNRMIWDDMEMTLIGEDGRAYEGRDGIDETIKRYAHYQGGNKHIKRRLTNIG